MSSPNRVAYCICIDNTLINAAFIFILLIYSFIYLFLFIYLFIYFYLFIYLFIYLFVCLFLLQIQVLTEW